MHNIRGRNKMRLRRRGSSPLPLFFAALSLFSIWIGVSIAQPVISIVPSATDVSVGEEFSVFVEVDPAGYTLQQAHADIIYDETKVSIVEVKNGGAFEYMFNNGTILDGIIDDIMGLGLRGVSSKGNLAEIVMRAESSGNFTIGISDAGVGTATETISPIINNGTVSISICRGDFNGDGYVNIDDVVYMVVNLWGPCEPGATGDFNGDGYVNIQDVIYMVIHLWGRCPQ